MRALALVCTVHFDVLLWPTHGLSFLCSIPEMSQSVPGLKREKNHLRHSPRRFQCSFLAAVNGSDVVNQTQGDNGVDARVTRTPASRGSDSLVGSTNGSMDEDHAFPDNDA